MKQETRDNVDRRLARIEGQVKALRRMVGEDRYCIDIARQVQAARAALSTTRAVQRSEQHNDRTAAAKRKPSRCLANHVA